MNFQYRLGHFRHFYNRDILMITYNEKIKSFFISAKDYSYSILINGEGYLQNLYYGKTIDQTDVEFMASYANSLVTRAPGDINYDERLGMMPAEYGAFAHGDFHDPSFIFEREDGSVVSRLLYKDYKIIDGAPQVEGMPHVRTADQTLIITVKDQASDVEIDLYYVVCENSNVLVRNAVVRNAGDKVINVKKAYSFCFSLPQGEYKMMKMVGRWATERIPDVCRISSGINKVQSTRGISSHNFNPFISVMRNDCTEDDGECYGVQLCYSGNFALMVEQDGLETPLRVQGGINDTCFNWKLSGGEQLVTPQAFICYSANGLGEMSREYHDFLRQRVINPNFVTKRRPIVINNWEATYFNFDHERLYPIIDASKGLGIDTFVLDDGWFGARVNDLAGLGDWVVNKDRFPQGLKSVIDRCKANGLNFGIWFEPEAVNEDSDLYRAHPDWAIKYNGITPARSRNQLVLDYSRKEVVDYIYNSMSEILANNDVSYVKWDMNRNITEYYSSNLPSDRQGELLHRYVLGVYDLAERLMSRFPNVFFEGCAGGGGRFDAGALYYFPQIWTSDDSDGLERTKIQWGTSMCYPLSSMSCHVSVCPNHQTGRTTPLATRGHIASLGATGYEFDLSKTSQEEKEQIIKQVEDYKAIDDLILNGDLYRISSPHKTNYFCEMVVSKDKTKAYVVGEKILAEPYDYPRFFRLKGLDPNKRYKIKECWDFVASGKMLMNKGVTPPGDLRDFSTWVWHLEEVK